DIRATALSLKAGKNVTVNGSNKDDIIQMSVSAGISGGPSVQIGAAVQVLKSKAIAHVGGVDDKNNPIENTAVAETGKFSLTAHNDTKLNNAAVAVGISGSAAITPVGVVTYFQGEADAQVLSNTHITAKHGIDIKATGDKEIGTLAVGAAASSVGISGTVSVIVSKDRTWAIANKGTTLTSTGESQASSKDTEADSINIKAGSKYALNSISGAVAGAGVSVAVNAVVSVMKSNIIAELSGTASAVKNVNVNADSTRSVTNLVGTASVGGVAVGVNAMVLVAGSKMSQDAADAIAYGDSKTKTGEKTFDAKAFMTKIEANGAASKYYNGDTETDANRKLDGDVLSNDLAGNGHYESENTVGSKTTKDGKDTTQFDSSSGYLAGDMDYLKTKEGENTNTNQGEHLVAKDSEDVENAKKLNTYTYDDSKISFEDHNSANASDFNKDTDMLVAVITSSGSITKAEGVTVTADQKVSADLFGANIAGGGVAVGVGVAVAILHSNVAASSVGTIRNVGDRGIEIKAVSHGGDYIKDAKAVERYKNIQDDMKGVAEEDIKRFDPSRSAIRAVGVGVGAGGVSVAVGVSVVLTDNITQAVLRGNVTTDGNTSVIAEHNYGNVMAATVNASVGGVGVGASVAVAQASGKVYADVGRRPVASADGSSTAVKDTETRINTRNLTIKTDAIVNVNSIAATACVGGVAVN
ncbi:MAG: hypothetical protein ACSW8J_07745, partial [bacterium]